MWMRRLKNWGWCVHWVSISRVSWLSSWFRVLSFQSLPSFLVSSSPTWSTHLLCPYCSITHWKPTLITFHSTLFSFPSSFPFSCPYSVISFLYKSLSLKISKIVLMFIIELLLIYKYKFINCPLWVWAFPKLY